MEVRIKLSITEVEQLCIDRCRTLTHAPGGHRWTASITSWDGATCDLVPDDELITPAPAPAPAYVPNISAEDEGF